MIGKKELPNILRRIIGYSRHLCKMDFLIPIEKKLFAISVCVCFIYTYKKINAENSLFPEL